VGSGVMVGVDVPLDTDHRLGVDDLRDGAGLCGGVLKSSNSEGNAVVYGLILQDQINA
jgi:hypothetical protein